MDGHHNNTLFHVAAVTVLLHIHCLCSIAQEPLKLWTELYSELIPNGGLEVVFFYCDISKF